MFGALVYSQHMQTNTIGKLVVNFLRNNRVLPILDFEQDFYYTELVEAFYREMRENPSASELMGNIRGQRVIFSPVTIWPQ